MCNSCKCPSSPFSNKLSKDTVPGMRGKNPLKPWPKVKRISAMVILLADSGMVPLWSIAAAFVH
eukprot:6111714-Amphidinium_carterae.1